MKASDLPWWGWLLGSAVFGFLAADGLVGIIGEPAENLFSLVVALVLLALSILLAVVGIIRFLKWAWKD